MNDHIFGSVRTDDEDFERLSEMDFLMILSWSRLLAATHTPKKGMREKRKRKRVHGRERPGLLENHNEENSS